MGEKEILKKIDYLKEHIPKIKNEKTRKEQAKYMHKLMKEINIYRRYGEC